MNRSCNLCIPYGIASAARILTAETPSCQHRLRGLQLMFSLLETSVSFEFIACIPCAPRKKTCHPASKQSHFLWFLYQKSTVELRKITRKYLIKLPDILSRGRAEVRFSSFGQRPEAWAPHGFHQVGSMLVASRLCHTLPLASDFFHMLQSINFEPIVPLAIYKSKQTNKL